LRQRLVTGFVDGSNRRRGDPDGGKLEMRMGIVYPGVPQKLALWLRDTGAAKDFIETGTYLAGTALWAAQHFDRIISIEADQKLYDAAKKRLASYANVDVQWGRSQDLLAALVPKLSQPALIWLDAHWCGGDVAVAGEDQECPLLEEIAAIDAGTLQHIILIDDARYFFNPPPSPHKREHWPSAATVIEQLRAKYDGYICVTDDVIIRLPIALRDSFEAFVSQTTDDAGHGHPAGVCSSTEVGSKMPQANICLFTSIRPPADAEAASYLRDCLNSWQTAGFDTIAVNGPAEAEVLRHLNLPIEFAVTAVNGRPRIGAIQSAIRARGCRFAGIINSDCRIIGYPNVAANLQAGLDRAVVLAWRIDVGPDLRPTTMRGGFDAYFFDTEVMPRDDCGFSIGDPWWDFWFPLACEMSGARVETLAIPLLTHKAHPAGWSEQTLLRSGHRFWAAFQSWHRANLLPKSLLAHIPTRLRLERTPPLDLLERLFGNIIPAWLHENRPQTIAIMGPEAAEIERVLRFGGRAMRNASCEAELAEICNSTSWRMTAPLRAAVTGARRITSTLKARRNGPATDKSHRSA